MLQSWLAVTQTSAKQVPNVRISNRERCLMIDTHISYSLPPHKQCTTAVSTHSPVIVTYPNEGQMPL